MTAYEPEDVIVDFLRRRVGTLDPNGSEVNKGNTATGDGVTTTFTVTPTSGKSVQVFKDVRVGGVSKKKYFDWDYNIRSNSVTFTIAPGNGVNINLPVNEAVGGVDWIYAFNPEYDLVLTTSFPRVQVTKISEDGIQSGSVETTSKMSYLSKIKFQIDIYDRNDNIAKSFGGVVSVGDIMVRAISRVIIGIFKTNADDLYPKLHNIKIEQNEVIKFDKNSQLFRNRIIISAWSPSGGN